MKKLLLIVFVFIGLTANAQVYLGGSFGMNKNGSTYSINIAPEVGYCISDHHSFSMSVGYSTIRENNTDEEYERIQAYRSLSVIPSYTYAIPFGENKWCFDINTSLGYSRGFEAKNNLVGLYFGPQLEYNLTEHWSLWGAFDVVSIEFEWYDKESVTSNYSLDWFNNGINFGFYYYF